MAVAEAEIEAGDASVSSVASRQTDKAKTVVLVVIVPQVDYLELI
jgi:hypothetical protein